jgi:phosphoglycolate phosphatase-like HAD superfamily hydrolase
MDEAGEWLEGFHPPDGSVASLMAERLILWDIDGTLIRAGAIAGEAFDRAVSRVLGRAVGDHGVQMSGKTDPLIAAEILAFAQGDEALVPTVVEHLEAELADAAEALREGGRVLPGVSALLSRLAGVDGVVQSVLTGNTAANAAVKLASFGLDQWIDVSVGAFGSDHAIRNELVPIALARLGRPVAPEHVWVIGDTPFDLACARAGGVRCLLVGTGRIPFSELSSLDADAALPDLSDTEAVLNVLLG